MNPFDFTNSITYNKKDLIGDSDNEELSEKSYSPFLINKSLSYFPDTVLYANEVNRYSHLDNKLQYYYLLYSIRSQKRFAKWVKKQDSNDFEAVKQFYGYSDEKASQALSLLSNDQISMIKKQLEKGG